MVDAEYFGSLWRLEDGDSRHTVSRRLHNRGGRNEGIRVHIDIACLIIGPGVRLVWKRLDAARTCPDSGLPVRWRPSSNNDEFGVRVLLENGKMPFRVSQPVEGLVLRRPGDRQDDRLARLQPQGPFGLFARSGPDGWIDNRGHYEIAFRRDTPARGGNVSRRVAQIDDYMTDAWPKPEQMIGMVQEKNGREEFGLSKGDDRDHIFAMSMQHYGIVTAHGTLELLSPA